MKRLRCGTSIAGAVTLLLLAAPVGSAAAAPEDPSASQQGGQGDQRRADAAEPALRKRPVEPEGNPASPAAMRAGRLSCGDVITNSTNLTADIGPCAGDGIIIGADNIFLNLNGHRVVGNNDQGESGEFAGIRVPGRTGVRVIGHPGGQRSGRTGTVSGFEAGVVIDGGSANTVQSLIAQDNIGPDDAFNAELGDGIIIFDSPANRIVDNVVRRNGIFDGIGVLGPASDENIIQRNTVEDTVGPSDGGPAGQGIIVNGADLSAGLISGTKTKGNIVRRNASAGIANINITEGEIAGNTVLDNGLLNARGNGIGLSTGPGVGRMATRVLIEGNEVHGNGRDGISIVYARENRILNNNAADNAVLSNVTDQQLAGSYVSYDLHEFTGHIVAGCTNEWFGNIWGSGYYHPPCTTTGGSGPPFPVAPEGPPGDPTCFDSIDNDQDGFRDYTDSDCQAPPEGPIGDPTCSDGRDNDLDDFTDGDDPDCGGDGGFGFGGL